MINPMDPVTLGVSAAALKIVEGLAADAVKKRATGVLKRLGPNEQEKAAKVACSLFAHEFLVELEDKTTFSSALPGLSGPIKAAD